MASFAVSDDDGVQQTSMGMQLEEEGCSMFAGARSNGMVEVGEWHSRRDDVLA